MVDESIILNALMSGTDIWLTCISRSLEAMKWFDDERNGLVVYSDYALDQHLFVWSDHNSAMALKLRFGEQIIMCSKCDPREWDDMITVARLKQ